MYIVGFLMALVGFCFVLSMLERPPGAPPPGMPKSGRRRRKQGLATGELERVMTTTDRMQLKAALEAKRLELAGELRGRITDLAVSRRS
jgi:hypothetical protein